MASRAFPDLYSDATALTESDGACVTCTPWNNVLVTLDRSQPQLEDLSSVERAVDDLYGTQGEPILVAVRCLPGTRPMDDDCRRALINDLVVGRASRIEGWALVFEGKGFESAAMFSAYAGLHLGAPASRIHVFQSLATAGRWLAPRVRARPPARAADVIDAIERITRAANGTA